MNSKINCISTKVGDTEDLLSEDRGILIEGFDYFSIAESIKAYLKLDNQKKE